MPTISEILMAFFKGSPTKLGRQAMQIAELVRRGYKLTLFDRNPHKKNKKKKRIGQLNSTKSFEKWALFSNWVCLHF